MNRLDECGPTSPGWSSLLPCGPPTRGARRSRMRRRPTRSELCPALQSSLENGEFGSGFVAFWCDRFRIDLSIVVVCHRFGPSRSSFGLRNKVGPVWSPGTGFPVLMVSRSLLHSQTSSAIPRPLFFSRKIYNDTPTRSSSNNHNHNLPLSFLDLDELSSFSGNSSRLRSTTSPTERPDERQKGGTFSQLDIGNDLERTLARPVHPLRLFAG
jgi:hypothetical protein